MPAVLRVVVYFLFLELTRSATELTPALRHAVPGSVAPIVVGAWFSQPVLLVLLIGKRNWFAGLVAKVQGNHPDLAVWRLSPNRHGMSSLRGLGGVPEHRPVQIKSPLRKFTYPVPPRPSPLWHGLLAASGSFSHVQSRSALGSGGVLLC